MKPNVPKSGFFSRIIIAAALSLMAACSPERAEPAEPTRTDTSPVDSAAGETDTGEATEEARVELVDASDLRPAEALSELDLTDGDWFMNGGEAMFGPPESEAIFTMGCDPQASEIFMTRSIDVTADGRVRLGVFTKEAQASGYWRDADDVMPIAMARLASSEPGLEEIAYSERFAVAAEGRPLLVLPVNEAVRAVIDECVV
ncbi:hypothetical protein D1224_04620 [Henriciella barbarensis]|uniref:Uncharacterized protein n=1 Tax=Henriciella barbarensis TaxID=86342 RepID=A0A399R1B1_9PROT|nr:hypothetical protein [Henriciella barbarensis]RIJ23552.1 hypothetical protein D1224_04620 [Henriciella barbarensis]